jgi:hypothetical protein
MTTIEIEQALALCNSIKADARFSAFKEYLRSECSVRKIVNDTETGQYHGINIGIDKMIAAIESVPLPISPPSQKTKRQPRATQETSPDGENIEYGDRDPDLSEE